MERRLANDVICRCCWPHVQRNKALLLISYGSLDFVRLSPRRRRCGCSQLVDVASHGDGRVFW